MPDRPYAFAVFLAQAVVISLSGVLAPGPVTAATVAAGARRRHAGALVALGHAAVELPLMGLILLGIGALLAHRPVTIAVGLAGGVMLLWMGGGMLAELRRPTAAATPRRRHPFWTGVVLSAANPYFLLWWATVGLNLAREAGGFGALAFAVFAAVHSLCDLAWLEALSQAAFHGSRRFSGQGFKVVLGLCGAALIGFGVKFLLGAAAAAAG
jgi:threonine/homoserine/homoserine lactone efflux protein